MAAPPNISELQQSVALYPAIISSSQIVIPTSSLIPTAPSQIGIPSSPSVGGVTVNSKRNAAPPGPSSLVSSSNTASRQMVANILKRPFNFKSHNSDLSGNPPPSTSSKLSTTSKPSAKNPVVNPQVGKAIAEKRASLFQELSKVMRDTAAAANSRRNNPKIAIPALKKHTKSYQPSPERTTSLKQNAVAKTVLPKEAVVIPSTTVSSNPSFIIPSVITSDVFGQMGVPLMPIVSTGNSSGQSQPSANLVLETAVSQSNNVLGSSESNSVVLQRGGTQPTIVYAVNSSPAQSSVSIPNSNQLYAIVQAPPVTAVEGVYGNIVPSVNSVPVAHVQNPQQVPVSSIQPTNVLNASPGTMVFAIVGNQNVVTAPNTPLTIGNSVPVLVEGSSNSTVNETELMDISSEANPSKPVHESSLPENDIQSSLPENDITSSFPENDITSSFPENDIPIDHPTDTESSMIIETGNSQELGSEGIFSEPIKETVKEPPKVKKTENSKLLIESSNLSVCKKSDRDAKKVNDIESSRPRGKCPLEKEKSEKPRSDHERKKPPENPPKELSARGVVETQLKRAQNFYDVTPPTESYLTVTSNDCDKLREIFEKTTRHMKSVCQGLKSVNDVSTSCYIPTSKADASRGQILCRLCAGFFKREGLLPLYKNESDKSHLVYMINYVVPDSMHVEALDGLPQDICKDCTDKLTGCYEIIQSFIRADKKLRGILGLQAITPGEELLKKQCVREEMGMGKLTTYTPTPQRRKRPRDSSSDRMTSESEVPQQRKRRQIASPSKESYDSSIDYSRFDPEYNVGFEVEWCLDEETLRSTQDTTESSEEKEAEGIVDQSESELRTEYCEIVEEGEVPFENVQEEYAEYIGDEHLEQTVNYQVEQTVNEHTEQTVNEHLDQTENEHTELTVDEHTELTIDEHAEQTTNEHTEQTTNEHTEQSEYEQTRQSANEHTEQSANECTEQSVNEHTELTVSEHTEQTVNEHTERTVNEHAEQTADEQTELIQDVHLEQTEDEHVEQTEDEHVEQTEDEHVEQTEDQHVEQTEDQHVEQTEDQHVEQTEEEYVEQTEDEYVEQTENEHVEQTETDCIEEATRAEHGISGELTNDPHVPSTPPCSNHILADIVPEASSHVELSPPSDREFITHIVSVEETVVTEHEGGDYGDEQPDEHQVENI